MVLDQTQPLDKIGTSIMEFWLEMEKRESQAAIIAKDADYLEAAISAKEAVELGYESAQDIIDNVGNALKTSSAKNLFAELQNSKASDWWRGFKKIP